MDEFELTRRALVGAADPAALARVRSRLDRAIEDARRPRWSPLRAAAAAAAVVGIVVLVVALALPMPTAAAELRRWGAIAATQDPLRPGPGEYLLIRSEELTRDGVTVLDDAGGIRGSFDILTRRSVSTWVDAEGSAVRRDRIRSWEFASEADREAWIDLGRPPTAAPDRTPGDDPIHDVGDLPTQPDELLAALRSRAEAERSPGDDQVFILVGEILAQGVAPPELRSALFEVAARLDGIASVGEVQDPLRRAGTGVELTTVNSRIRLVFDPDSARLLAIETFATGSDGVERVSSWSAFQPTIVVETAPPPAG